LVTHRRRKAAAAEATQACQSGAVRVRAGVYSDHLPATPLRRHGGLGLRRVSVCTDATACTATTDRTVMADGTVIADGTAQLTAITAGFRCSAIGSACGVIEQDL
jgi:hypothetical protein